MGFIIDLLKDIPINAVLREKIEGFERDNEALRQENAKLKQQLGALTDASRCPRCGKHAFKLIESRPDPIYSALGGTERTYRCDECGLEEKKITA